MAENKKSFVAYTDWGDIFDELSDDEAGKLVKHLFDYVRDKNPVAEDKLTKMMFIQIQQSLKRDLVKYDKYIDKQSVNGKKGGRPKNPTVTQKTQPFIHKPKKADSVNVSVSVNDSVNDNDIIFDFEQSLVDYGFQPMLVKDWLKVRSNKKGTNSQTALNAFIKVIKRAEGQGLDKNAVMAKCVEKDWRGLEYKWLENIGMVEKWQSPA